MLLKKGSQGEAVRILQVFLNIEDDGDFGPNTEIAVKKWQKAHGLLDDGVVGNNTWNAMGIATTDITETFSGFDCAKSFLPIGEYMKGPTNKKWIFLHHTAGWNDPFKTISAWGKDTRGPIATEFILGGQSINGKDNTQDGVIVQAFPTGGYAWHLGIGNIPMHKESIGVEVCSFGQLTKGGYTKYENGKNTWIPLNPSSFYTYVGIEAAAEQIVTLSKPFRGFIHWHKYSDAQINSIYLLLKYISERDGIDMKKGIKELIKTKGVDTAFNFCDVNYVALNPGLWTHANVLKGKTDMFPQQELVDMIMSL